jgi:hypothetical protein
VLTLYFESAKTNVDLTFKNGKISLSPIKIAYFNPILKRNRVRGKKTNEQENKTMNVRNCVYRILLFVDSQVYRKISAIVCYFPDEEKSNSSAKLSIKYVSISSNGSIIMWNNLLKAAGSNLNLFSTSVSSACPEIMHISTGIDSLTYLQNS